jgi:hypothetical protein
LREAIEQRGANLQLDHLALEGARSYQPSVAALCNKAAPW